MAREILFKAKRKDNGEWVEGYYFCMVHDDGRHVHHFIMPLGSDLSLGTSIEKIQVEIDINTLCQYTGLTDKNGKKIWENDVCTCKKRGCAFFGCVVKWNRVKARFDVNAMGCNFPMTLEECLDGVSINGLDYEVIGNIFDNPELLGGADNG